MKKLIPHTLLAVLFLFSCSRESEPADNENSLPVIYASIPPLEFILEYLCGDDFEVRSLLTENDNPHTYSVKPSDLRRLQEAEVLVQIGKGFENYLTDSIRSNLKDLEIIDTAEHITLIIPEEHDHTDGDEKHNESFDPHFWLGIPQIIEFADYVTGELIRLYPSKKELLEFQLAGFKTTAGEMDEGNRQLLEYRNTDSFLVFHPSFSYFADYYNLEQVAVEVDGKAPTPRQLNEAVKKAEEHNIRVIISQPQFPETSIRAITQAIGGKAIEINHLNKDIFSTMTDLCLALTGGGDESE